MGRVERRAVDRGDDVTGLEARLVGRAAGDDRVVGRWLAGLAAEPVRDLTEATLAERVLEAAVAVRILRAALTVRVLGATLAVVAPIALGGSGRRGRDPCPVVDRQAVRLLDGRVDGLEADAEVRAGQRLAGARLGEQRLGDVDRDREPDALRL